MASKEWPSEDEDFDAVSNKQAGRTPVAVVDNSDETPAEPVVPRTENEASEGEAPPETIPKETVPESAPAAAPIDDSPTPTMQNSNLATDNKKRGVGRLLFELVLVLAVAGLGLLAWSLSTDLSNLKKQVSQLNANPQVAVQKQTEAIVSRVGSLIQLPQGETPTVANVSDAAKAKQQSPFFANAQNGDVVLLYIKASQAILYRPSTNKIILQAPLTFTNTSTSITPKTPAAVR